MEKHVKRMKMVISTQTLILIGTLFKFLLSSEASYKRYILSLLLSVPKNLFTIIFGGNLEFLRNNTKKYRFKCKTLHFGTNGKTLNT